MQFNAVDVSLIHPPALAAQATESTLLLADARITPTTMESHCVQRVHRIAFPAQGTLQLHLHVPYAD